MSVIRSASRRSTPHTRSAGAALLATVATLGLVAPVAAQSLEQLSALIDGGQKTARQAQELEARRERQMRVGLIEEAARTSQLLEELTRAQIAKCGAWWDQSDSLQRGVIPKNRITNTQTIMRLAAECQWRPGAPQNDRRNALRTPDDDQERRLLSERQGASRAPLFVEPALLTWTLDADVMDAAGSGLRAVEESPALEQIFEDANRAMASSNWAEADTLLEQMLSMIRRSPGAKPGAIAMVLEQRRAIQELLGNIPAAFAHAREQLELLEQSFGPASVNLCPSLWQLASLLAALDQADAAIAAADRCIDLAAPRGTSSLTYASALNNLGVVHHRLGDLERAVAAYEKSLAAFDQMATTPTTAILGPTLSVHANLGLVFWQRGDAARAYRHLQLAREQMLKEGGTHTTETGAVRGLARLSAELDIFLTVERAVAAMAPGGTPLGLPMLLERKGFGLGTKQATMKTLGQDAEALREYRTLLARRAALARAQPANAEAGIERRTLISEIDRQILILETNAAMAAASSAALSARMAPDSLRRQREYGMALADAIEKRSSEYFRRRPKNDSRSQEEVLQEIQRQAEAEVNPRFKDIFESMGQQARGTRESLLPAIQSKLSDAAVLVEMVRFRPFTATAKSDAQRWAPARYGAYVVRRSGTPAFIDYGDAATIDDLIVEFRRTLSVPRGTLAHDLGRRLDEALMQPMRAHLGVATQIYVAPDGMLNLVPFAALVDEQERYLIESFTFNYLSSGRDLLREPTPDVSRPAPPVVIADPLFDGSSGAAASDTPLRSVVGTRFEALPGTAGEAEAIKGLLREAEVLTRERATETAIKSVTGPRILHVATHGFFLEDQDLSAAQSGAADGVEDPMLRSGLVFAGANAGRSGGDDGVLTALEAGALGLAGTELVVLSACETGVGEVKTGEGVFGLRRALMVAGAETLVMSLWRVDDEATRVLMVEFYRRLAKGEGRAEALRQASLTLLRDPVTRHPFYWASFIASGETGRLRR